MLFFASQIIRLKGPVAAGTEKCPILGCLLTAPSCCPVGGSLSPRPCSKPAYPFLAESPRTASDWVCRDLPPLSSTAATNGQLGNVSEWQPRVASVGRVPMRMNCLGTDEQMDVVLGQAAQWGGHCPCRVQGFIQKNLEEFPSTSVFLSLSWLNCGEGPGLHSGAS